MRERASPTARQRLGCSDNVEHPSQQRITHWYKQSVYDPQDNKMGEIMDVLVDRDGKVTALIIGVGWS